MFSFLNKFNKKTTKESIVTNVNLEFEKLKQFYDYNELSEERKDELKQLIEEYGYLPYPYIKALEELTPAEILYGLELKFKNNGIYQDGKFTFTNDKISPAQRCNYKNGDWIKKEQHNIKLINLAGLGNGNKTKETGKLIDWLRQTLILPAGLTQKNVLGTTIYLIPFHPREFGCAYLPTSSTVSPNLEDKEITQKLNLSLKEQVKLYIILSQLAGHCVIYDILPQTGRFSKMVLSNPYIARWYDIKELIGKIEAEIDIVSEELKLNDQYLTEDIDIVCEIYKKSLNKGSHDLSEPYQAIFKEIEAMLIDKKKEFSNEMLKKEKQATIHKRVFDIVSKINNLENNSKCVEDDITNQIATIEKLINDGLWPAPGGAWCSSGVPVFNKMAESGEYPIFKHYDYNGNDVSEFANLDCQTPYYFVHLENGEFNEPVVDFYIEFMKKLQKEYNFDGFRVDHIDHIVDAVSEKDGNPISYRAPRKVLGQLNRALKEQVPHFATLAEYMLWDSYLKEYHEDMSFDILWGNDIISQHSKTPDAIITDNQMLEEYNLKCENSTNPLSILKSYNNQDGEFRAIDQYPGQLGEKGALFKWFKYKFLHGGKNAQRPVMHIDGDESFTKTGIESVIGEEVSMKREKNYEFYDKFNAINSFALENILTREGEAQVIQQDNDGFVSWMISKDPLKKSLLVVANYKSPTEKINDNGNCYFKDGDSVFNKSIQMPCDCSITGEYIYNSKTKKFEEINYETHKTELSFEEIAPAEFKIYKITR